MGLYQDNWEKIFGKTESITQKELDDLGEYSCSLPTGTIIGKRWKCKKDYNDVSKGWLIAEYVPSYVKNMIGIKWKDAVVVND